MIEDRLLASGISAIAGVDEAGRGACAGPLVIAAIVLNNLKSPALAKVRDSKMLSAKLRAETYELIIANAKAFSIIEITSAEIDSQGLHRCNIEGMRRAIQALDSPIDYVLTDGYPIPGLAVSNLAVWKGDQVALSISAASILAKVSRDRIMEKLDQEYPGYGIAEHKGYGTAAHHRALEKLGVSPIHRKSYANVAKFLNN